MVDAADWPDDGVESGCGRAVDIPDTGSAFDGGQRPLAGFFRGPHPPCSPFAATASPFVWAAAGAVHVFDEDEDATEEDELVRWALFRG